MKNSCFNCQALQCQVRESCKDNEAPPKQKQAQITTYTKKRRKK